MTPEEKPGIFEDVVYTVIEMRPFSDDLNDVSHVTSRFMDEALRVPSLSINNEREITGRAMLTLEIASS